MDLVHVIYLGMYARGRGDVLTQVASYRCSFYILYTMYMVSHLNRDNYIQNDRNGSSLLKVYMYALVHELISS